MERNIVDCLMDEEYDGLIYLQNESGKEEEFVQIALIPFDNTMYAIVVSKAAMDKNDIEDAGIVLSLNDEKGTVEQVVDADVINEVFDIYDRLFEEQE